MHEEDYNTQYLKMGLPEYYSMMNSRTPIYIEFTDIIQDRYRVDVEWFPDYGLAPLLTGPANIHFRLTDRDIKFSVRNELFSIRNDMFSFPNYRLSRERIESKEPIKMLYRHLANPPFAFGDMNFDGTKELVLLEARGGQRFFDEYKVHLIQEGVDYFNVVDLSETKPYSSFDESTEFDWDNKTVNMYYSGGACSSIYELYERVFDDNPLKNYDFKLIKRTEYDYQDKKGKNIGCHVYVYDYVDDKKILNEKESGPVK